MLTDSKCYAAKPVIECYQQACYAGERQQVRNLKKNVAQDQPEPALISTTENIILQLRKKPGVSPAN